MRNRHLFILAAFCILLQGKLSAQIIIEEEPKRLYYEYTGRVKKFKNMKNFRDVFHLNKLLMGKRRISGNISYNTGRVLVDDGNQMHEEIRSALGFYTRYRFVEEFCINTTFYKNFNPRADAPWVADFTYSIGRYNWRPKKLNFGFENYASNKYSDSWKEIRKKMLEGYLYLSYNYSPSKLNKRLRIDSTSSFRLIFFTRYAIKYRNENEQYIGGLLSGKPTFGTAFRYTILRNIYFESGIYYYFRPDKKQPWDPDFSYGFGYFDWRAFRVSATYGNWSINRFPGNSTSYPKYGFLDGQFRIVGNWAW